MSIIGALIGLFAPIFYYMITYTKIFPCYSMIVLALFIYGIEFVSILVLNLSIYLKLFVLLFFLKHACKVWSHSILLNANAAVVGLAKTSVAWVLEMSSKDCIYATLKKTSLVSRFILLLQFQGELKRKFRVIITPRSVGVINFRRLLIYLLHEE